MRRIAFNLVAAVAAVLCFTIIALWVRSYWRCDSISRSRTYLKSAGMQTWGAASWRGRVELYRSRGMLVEGGGTDESHWIYRSDTDWLSKPLNWKTMGFEKYSFGSMEQWHAGQSWTVPDWFLVLITAAIPAARWFTWRRISHADGTPRCPACGYDLRATPERCPECGTPSASSVQAAARRR